MSTVTREVSSLAVARASRPHALVDVLLTALIPLLAVVAGAIHLVHTYLPMSAASHPAGAPPAGAGQAAGGLMSLVGPHLSEAFVLNFVAYVVLAALFLTVGRVRPRLRAPFDLLLIVLSVATLEVWNAMGRANPSGLGTWALVAELALIALAAVDVVRQRRAIARGAAV
jgi:hypothetical protein